MEGIDPDDPPKPCDYFDMICGTSTGGLIAIMLGRLHMSVAERIIEYQKLSNNVFTKCHHRVNMKGNIQGRFDHKALETGIKDLLQRRGLDEDDLLKEHHGNPQCKTFVRTMSQETSDTVVFPNYYSPTWGKPMLDRIRIWEAARDTSAATSFFELLAAEASSTYSLYDGWKLEDHLKCLVSIGTGIPSRKPFGPGLIEVAAALKAIATESEAKAEQFKRQHLSLVRNSILFRFNVIDGLQGIGLEAANRLGEIEASTDRYCATVSVTQQVRACASKLREKPWITDATLAFDHRFGDPSLKSLNRNSVGHIAEPKLERFIHTKVFQQWLCNTERCIVCTTPTESASTRETVSPQSTLTAALSGYAKSRSRCVVLYVDCFWIFQTPKKTQLEAIASELQKEKTKLDDEGDDPSNSVLESLYSQLFSVCDKREEVLKRYNDFLSPEESSRFRAHILANGLPRKQDLLQLLSRLRSSPSAPAIISIYRMNFLEDSARQTLMPILMALKAYESFKLLLCGDKSLLLTKSIAAHNVIISVSTEIEGARSHPVYQSFSVCDSGILWIRGKPGSGKSVLARSIQKRLRELSLTKTHASIPLLVGDWFYHRRRGGGFVRHESFVRSILYHFLQQDFSVFQNFLQEAYREMDPREKGTWTYELLVNIFTRICRSSTSILVIVDAVDEAENAQVLALIKSVISETTRSKARFIDLSRPNVQIERQIEGEPTIIVEHENQRDIEQIIDLGFASLQNDINSLDFPTSDRSRKPLHLPRHSRMLKPRLRSLVTTAEREKRLAHEAQRGHGATLEELYGLVSQIPEELAEYYEQLTHELTANKDARTISEIRMALMWICAAAKIGDVTLESLWEALALLKSDFKSKTLEAVWQRQLSVNSYNELWRKISMLCGPFIEIFNPGLSADESRIYHYDALSIVQLIHQSVRDFLCDPDIKDAVLYFSLDEARKMKLLHLATEIGQSECKPLLTTLWQMGPCELQEAIDDPECSLVKMTKVFGDGCTSDEALMIVGRLTYHICTTGLVTAMRNLFSLKWLTAGLLVLPCGKIITSYILFGASRCQSSNIAVGIDLLAFPQEPPPSKPPLPKHIGAQDPVPGEQPPPRYHTNTMDLMSERVPELSMLLEPKGADVVSQIRQTRRVEGVVEYTHLDSSRSFLSYTMKTNAKNDDTNQTAPNSTTGNRNEVSTVTGQLDTTSFDMQDSSKKCKANEEEEPSTDILTSDNFKRRRG
ncbi:hypothetical protein GGR58DRAFT_507980 [Xylaria digitata]|nr:hypothetical protein GGR58DRAFT_507980 [Xylaria digitata]